MQISRIRDKYNDMSASISDVSKLNFCWKIYRTSNRRDLSNRVYASDAARADAIEKAEKLESRLGTECPTFVKSMLQSHVTGGFWLVSWLVLLGPDIYFLSFNHIYGCFSIFHREEVAKMCSFFLS